MSYLILLVHKLNKIFHIRHFQDDTCASKMSIGLGPKVHIFAVPYQINSNMVATATALSFEVGSSFVSLLSFWSPLVLSRRFVLWRVFHLVQVLLIYLSSRVGFLFRRVQM
jgi:hypothetical protein